MFKFLKTSFITLLISFAFTINSYAIILENLPTDSNSVQPVPASIISNMSKSFDISVYNFNYENQNFGDTSSADESDISNSEIETNQNNISDQITSHNFWYWFATFIIITFILFWIIRRIKQN